MEGDIHTLLDFATLVSTFWVIYMMRFKLKSTYKKKLDNVPIHYLVYILCYDKDIIFIRSVCNTSHSRAYVMYKHKTISLK